MTREDLQKQEESKQPVAAASTNPYAPAPVPPAQSTLPPNLQLLDQSQTDQLRTLMVTLVTNNQFNAYCIDCYQRQSTHANITYGTFVCEPCAQVHLMYFGMHKHYVKEIFTEHWDPH